MKALSLHSVSAKIAKLSKEQKIILATAGLLAVFFLIPVEIIPKGPNCADPEIFMALFLYVESLLLWLCYRANEWRPNKK